MTIVGRDGVLLIWFTSIPHTFYDQKESPRLNETYPARAKTFTRANISLSSVKPVACVVVPWTKNNEVFVDSPIHSPLNISIGTSWSVAWSSPVDRFSFLLESSPVRVSGNLRTDLRLRIEEREGVCNAIMHFIYHFWLVQSFVSSSFGVAFSTSNSNRCSFPSPVKFYLKA